MIKFHKKIKTIIVAVIMIGLVSVVSWTLFAKNQKFWILSFGSQPVTVASDFVDSNVSEKKVGKKQIKRAQFGLQKLNEIKNNPNISNIA